jgi:hypothetical protein
MSKFKRGDRIQSIERPDIIGTITHIEETGMAYIVLDSFITIKNFPPLKEGYITAEVEAVFKLIEKSDWASIWDDAAEEDK